jgi:hypothetical protein
MRHHRDQMAQRAEFVVGRAHRDGAVVLCKSCNDTAGDEAVPLELSRLVIRRRSLR